MANIYTPVWRSVAALLRALQKEKDVKDCICTKFESYYHEDDTHRKYSPDKVTAKEEAIDNYKDLIDNLLVVDLNNCIYWIAVYFLFIVFLIFEATLISIYVSSDFKDSLMYYLFMYVIIFMVAVFLLLFNTFVKIALKKNPNTLWNYSFSELNSILAIVAIFGLLSINLLIIWKSGGNSSPFLPALITLCTLVIALPRVNSTPVIISTMLAIIAGIIFLSMNFPVPQEEIQKWGGEDAKNLINLLTFVYAAFVTIILRVVSNRISIYHEVEPAKTT